MLALDNASISRGGRLLIENADVSLTAGITCLVGENGSGKSSLLRVLATLAAPTSGRVSWGDVEDIWDSATTLRSYRTALGWVPQGQDLPSSSTAANLIAYAAWLKGVSRAEAGPLAKRAAQTCDVEHLVKRRLGRLSGGERQRVILAAAIVARPGVLLLDEPTVGLDPRQRASFLEVLRSLADNTVILMSTHLMEDVGAVAERVLLVRDRRLHEGPALAELPDWRAWA